MEVIVTELIRFAFTGINVIPTALLILMQLYWLVAITGFLDFDLFDVDLDVEGADASGPLSGIAVLVNSGDIPFALVLSMIFLNFWISSMLLYVLPIQAGGLISAVLLIPAFFLSLYITKLELIPIRKLFFERKNEEDIAHRVLYKRCTLKSDVEYGRLGQAEIMQDGVSIVINVTTADKHLVYKKGETVFVFSKDKVDDVYFITTPLMNDGNTI
ncbi:MULTISPECIES: hypothetical protein [unclassified Fusibacter]|uniref:hypothetical protein n=1 Tax=unclassified Fusibacter TaxID=2624464 RepID=UPI0010110934|nr:MULTISPECIES: hypothetical protein [unclassified Fusibacter]MCK8058957.1 hypothetical protein [Fusibacter sp. A2]NPE22034.1 hypothetical protein [Fusibacter sp. A1]RXV61598.1 hypothetical protein DWB64_09325 [Fusibacter sp. A1]